MVFDAGALIAAATRSAPRDALCKAQPSADIVPITLDARRKLFFTLDRTLSALAERGSKRCGKVTKALDAKYAADSDSDPRTMLRARCALCPDRCKKPLA